MQSALIATALCAGLPAVPIRIGDVATVSVLTLPDGSTITLPLGEHSPMEHLPPSTPPPPATAPVGKPTALGADPKSAQGTPAERRKHRIDELFARLAAAQDAPEAEAISLSIDRLWLQSDSPTADLLMARAVAAIGAKDSTTAAALLDKIIVLRPGWAEAWNKRATVRYLQDDDAGSMEDISHVLVLEPRHFGALSGMGFILHRNGDDKAALTVLRRALAVDPQQPEVKALIDQLTPDVEGHAL